MPGWLKRTWNVVANTHVVQRIVRHELEKLAAEPWSGALIADFIDGNAGDAYGVTAAEKEVMIAAFRRCNADIPSGTSPLVHVVLAREILSIPPDVKGDVVECGAWKGASSASLSLVCARVGRKLWVCDSFQGLPDDGLQRHEGLHTGVYGYYREGMFEGALEEVRANIVRCGRIDACEFVKGFFAESLKALHGSLVFAFLDVDLVSSTRDCLRHLWPLLVEDAAIYTDDAGDLDVVKVFFDDAWWQETFGTPAPGYVGSGCGLPLNPKCSSIGYTRKRTRFDAAQWRRAPFLYYPEIPGEIHLGAAQE